MNHKKWASIQHLVQELVQAFERAIQRAIDPTWDNKDRLYFTIQSNQYVQVYYKWNMTVGKWRAGQTQIDRMFNRLEQLLYANQAFEPQDTFHVTITHVPRTCSGKDNNNDLRSIC